MIAASTDIYPGLGTKLAYLHAEFPVVLSRMCVSIQPRPGLLLADSPQLLNLAGRQKISYNSRDVSITTSCAGVL